MSYLYSLSLSSLVTATVRSEEGWREVRLAFSADEDTSSSPTYHLEKIKKFEFEFT